MHSVDIGVGGDDNLVVTESLDAVLDVEGGLKQVEFVILVDHLTRHSVRVERLAAQGEAWVSALRTLVIVPEAESPSVMKMADS